MTWTRLYVTVEGQSERDFVKNVLAKHLAAFGINAMPRVIISNRKRMIRGGVTSYARIRGDLIRTMSGDSGSDARFTTMLDLYGLPGDCPGWDRARAKHDPVQRVAILEDALRDDLGDPRFMPYIQLHEFEALLYCDLSELGRRIEGSARGLAKLAAEVGDLGPEEIDDGPATAPSKRIIKYVPLYEKSKVRVGAPAAAAIPLSLIRSKCPHFDAWVGGLEQLGRG